MDTSDDGDAAFVAFACFSNAVRLLLLFLNMPSRADPSEGAFFSVSIPVTSLATTSFDASALVLASTFPSAAESSTVFDDMTGAPSEASAPLGTTAGTTSFNVADTEVPTADVIFSAPSLTSALTSPIDITPPATFF